ESGDDGSNLRQPRANALATQSFPEFAKQEFAIRRSGNDWGQCQSFPKQLQPKDLLIGSSAGEKRTSLTTAMWPGSLYSSLADRESQTTTVRSPAPAHIFSPLASQLARIRFFSRPVGAPSYIRIERSTGAKGRIS